MEQGREPQHGRSQRVTENRRGSSETQGRCTAWERLYEPNVRQSYNKYRKSSEGEAKEGTATGREEPNNSTTMGERGRSNCETHTTTGNLYLTNIAR